MTSSFTDQFGVTRLRGTLAGPGIAATVTRDISAAEVLSIFTSPVELLPAPDSGFVAVPTLFVVTYQAGGTPYTDNGGALNLIWDDDPASGLYLINTADFWDQATDQIATQADVQMGAAVDTYEGKAVSLAQTTADPEDGDGTLRVTFTYLAVAL